MDVAAAYFFLILGRLLSCYERLRCLHMQKYDRPLLVVNADSSP